LGAADMAEGDAAMTHRFDWKALGRLPAGKANKTEAAYGDFLELRKRAGEVLWFKFEGMKFKLADNTFYTPDYSVLLADGTMEMHEIKGFMTDDANVKIKVAADLYPFAFCIVRKGKTPTSWTVTPVGRQDVEIA
jgi:hypothetical protein